MIAALALLLLVSPIGTDVYSLPKLAAVCVIVLVSFWDCRYLHWWPDDLKPWAAFAAALFVSTFFSWDLGNSIFGLPHSRGLGLVEWGACALLFLYGCNRGQDALDEAVFYGGGVTAALACAQWLAGINRGAMGATQGGPVALGEMLVVCFPVAWRAHRALAVTLMIAALAVHCRSAILAMVVTALYLWKDGRPLICGPNCQECFR